MTRQLRVRELLVTIGCIGGLIAACAPAAPPEFDPRGVPVTTTTVPPGYPTTPAGDDLVRLNEIQVAGTHNSYHIAPPAVVYDFLANLSSSFQDLADAIGDVRELDYTHATIPQQLERGLRTFEFDIYRDPAGGRFASPALAGLLNYSDPLLDPEISDPGIKVIHVADVDWRTQCGLLTTCLDQIRQWSDANPGHLPISIMLEMKGTGTPLGLPGTPLLPFDTAGLAEVDAAITAALGDRLITPDDVRGASSDLPSAIATNGWPTLADSRGKVMFFMDNGGAIRDTYRIGAPALQGRAMFTSSTVGEPDSAVVKVNDPGDGTYIESLVSSGYIVRTRADATPGPHAVLSPIRRDTALASGAQVIHTDHPVGEPSLVDGYVVDLGLPVQGRCNPVLTTPATCPGTAIVEP